MTPRLHTSASETTPSGFSGYLHQMAGAALHEICPAGSGADAAALGFSLSLAAYWARQAGVVWAGEEGLFAEDGAPYPPGLAQFGLDPSKLIVIRAKKRDEALWAAEQGLSASGAVVICALSDRSKPLELKGTRRLLLFAERNNSRCLLLRPLTDASSAWTRWAVAPAPSDAAPREFGPPAFSLELTRNRAGPAGARFIVEWNAHEHRFAEHAALARDLSAAPEDRSVDPIRARG